ncbi:MAG: DUF262 domain-containing protein, partial [Myxococcota bacterium]
MANDSSRSAARPSIVSKFEEALGPERVVVEGAANTWPLRCSVLADGEPRDVDVYLARVGKSGRAKRPHERRIQNPRKGATVVANAERVSLLIGLDTEREPPCFVFWDPRRREGRSTRYSAFVDADTIARARRNGLATQTSSTDELVVAATKECFDEALRKMNALGRPGLPSVSPPLCSPPPTLRNDHDMTEKANEEISDQADDGHEELSKLVASLSEPCESAPSGFGPYGPAFEPEDVDWTTTDWVSRLLQVQPWLNLEETLAADSSAEEVLQGIWGRISLPDEDTKAYVEYVDSQPQLTTSGQEALAGHLENAIRHRADFEEKIEEGLSRKKAIQSWVTAWEEDTSLQAGPVEVNASVTTYRIRTFSDQANEGVLVLNPSYQRDTVWSDKESNDLIDSILRGIPLPSIILNQRRGEDAVEIVDGKQRLTAILRFIGKHPDGLRFAKRKSEEAKVSFDLFDTNYKQWLSTVKREVGISTTSEEDAKFLPFKYKLPAGARKDDPLARLSGKYYYEIKSEEVYFQGKNEKIERVLQGSTTKYELPVILYEDTDVRQIHSVFGLYNRQGKKLNATEVRNAIYHHLAPTRLLLLLAGDSDDIGSLASYLEGEDLLSLEAIPELFEGMAVKKSRFNRTKVLSWVVALLVSRPKGSPGSTKFVETLMAEMSAKPGHPLVSTAACSDLAKLLVTGAELMMTLRNMSGFAPTFTDRSSPGEKWSDPSTVAGLVATTIAALVEIEP